MTVLLSSAAIAATGRSGAILMQQTFGARPFTMGQAYAAYGDDIFGMSYNPAIIGRLRDSQFATVFTQSIANTQFGYAAFATPLNPTQALGASVAYLDGGKIDIFDDNGNISDTRNLERDFLVHLDYAHSFEIGENILYLGGAGKLFKSTIVQEVTSTGFAGDIGGLLAAPAFGGTATAGLSATNFGPKLKYTGGLAAGLAGDPLPLTVRAAAGYSMPVLNGDSIGGGLELDRVFYDNSLFEGAGLEYLYHGALALRVGYRAGPDISGLRIGVGVNFKGLSFDYGMGLVQTFNNIQQFSLTYKFNIPGIQYGKTASPSPLEALVKQAHTAIKERRLFDALAEVERIENFFPDSGQALLIRHDIDALADQLLINRPLSDNTLDANSRSGAAGYAYALGFKKYETNDWPEAVENLQLAARSEPNNREIRKYLDRAKKKQSDRKKQVELEQQARNATLFSLANQAFDDGDYDRAVRIADEILRVGYYQPARSLKIKIDEARRQAARKPAIKAPAPAPARPAASLIRPAPTPEEARRAEQLYYDAVRDYAENNLQESLRKLDDALRLNPDSKPIRNTLDNIEREYEQRKKGGNQ